MADTREIIPTVLFPERITLRFLGEAFASFGAVRVSDTLPLREVNAFMEAARRAFELTDDAKERCRRVGLESGYTPPSIEGVIGHGPDPLRHFWDITRDAPRIREVAPEFYGAAARLFTRLTALAARTLEAFDAAHGSDVLPDARGGSHSLRTSQYLNTAIGRDDVLFPAHVDFSLLTLYVGGAEGGLQVKHDGAWYDLWNPPGSVVIGVGTTLRLYAPEKAKPLRHQVMGASLGRISAVLFIEPRFDVTLPSGETWQVHLDRLMNKVRSE